MAAMDRTCVVSAGALAFCLPFIPTLAVIQDGGPVRLIRRVEESPSTCPVEARNSEVELARIREAYLVFHVAVDELGHRVEAGDIED
jgi:hypothetical protein